VLLLLLLCTLTAAADCSAASKEAGSRSSSNATAPSYHTLQLAPPLLLLPCRGPASSGRGRCLLAASGCTACPLTTPTAAAISSST